MFQNDSISNSIFQQDRSNKSKFNEIFKETYLKREQSELYLFVASFWRENSNNF